MGNRAKSWVIFSLVLALIIFAAIASERNKARLLENQRQQEATLRLEREEKMREFQASKQQILTHARGLYEANQYEAVLSYLRPYSFANDGDILFLLEKTQDRIRELRNKKRVSEILAKLRKIPASEYRENRDLYFRLTELDADNKLFAEKYNYYQMKLDELERKNMTLAELRGGRPVRNSYDGGYSEVRTYLKKVAHDPDSIKIDGCTDVFTADEGTAWLVGCDYRGRNAFGGIVRQSNWFKIVHGRVVSMEDSSVYAP